MAWFMNLVDRVGYMRDWVIYGEPSRFWLAGFFFPQSFVTSVTQSAARAAQCEIDTLGLKVNFLDQVFITPTYSERLLNFTSPREPVKPPSRAVREFVVEVYGLTIQGARADHR